MTRIARLTLLVALTLVGCKTRNELSCEAPENVGLPECSNIDAPTACSDIMPCTTGVCGPGGFCVECVTSNDCAVATKPVCNAMSVCEACNANSDCPSELCLSTGACAAEADVAYVATNGVAGGCEKATPCADINQAVLTTKANIKVVANTHIRINAETTINRAVSIFAEPGSSLERMDNGRVMRVSGGGDVAIQGLQVTSGSGNAVEMDGTGTKLVLDHVVIDGNNGIGVSSNLGAKLTMRSCIVANNTQGGVSVQNVAIDITNSLFVANGSGGSNIGGLALSPNSGSTFAFNTIADNVSSAGSVATRGVSCGIAFPANSNVVTTNALGLQCTFTFSLFDSSTAVLPGGTGNMVGDPKFDKINLSDLLDPRFYRVKDLSAVIDHGDPAQQLNVDIDGDARPKGTAPDIGADEH